MSVLDRFRLEGRTAILTGVGPGVGEHVAKAYAELGANVVISARSYERLERIAAEINALTGGRALAVAADAGNKPDLENLVAQARAAFGPIHIVFNNAATGVVYAHDGGLWANSDEVWKTALEVNVMATWRLTELTESDMKAHGKGSIISVQSCGGFTPIPPAVAYGVSKAALLFLVRELAKTQAPHTRINCLCVGSMSPDGQEAEIHKGLGLAERNAIKRFGAADEAVGAAILLASDASELHYWKHNFYRRRARGDHLVSNPLYTPDQEAVEKLALRLIEREDVRSAREVARRDMRGDPAASSSDGALGLDRALDQWVLALAMREANGDPADPRVVWNVSNPPRHWFGHAYSGAAVAVDNPDNFNREIPIDGAGNYALDICFSDNPPQFSIVIEMEPEDHAGLGRNIGALTLQQLLPHCDSDRCVRITVGPQARGPLHLQSEPGRIQIYTRDSQADWNQRPADVRVQRLDPPANWKPRLEDEIAAAIIVDMPAWVRFWRGFKDEFLGYPQPNRMIGPNGRDGNWGYLAGGRFAIADDEAVLVTLDPASSYYTGFQITDPWTIAPDPMLRMASLNKSQCTPNADGSVTYAVALADPGVANWIDSCGLHEGWMLTRWQGVPANPPLERMIRDVRLVKLDEIPADIPRVDLIGRRKQIVARARAFAQRTDAKGWSNAG